MCTKIQFGEGQGAEGTLRLTPRETTIVAAIRDPESGHMKRIAHDLGISYGYLKLRVNGLYKKLEWPTERRDIRRLALWAVKRDGDPIAKMQTDGARKG